MRRRAADPSVPVWRLSGGGWWWLAGRASRHADAPAPSRRRPTRSRCVVAAAEQRDVPIWLEGLGTVQASATVTVKPHGRWPADRGALQEGQDVHAGDVLARIDPRTYQAALDRRSPRRQQDEANLANARLDLARYDKLAATAYTSAQQADTQRATVAQLEAQVAQDQAQIDNARTQLSYTTITAPIDGRVGIRLVDPGNIVHAADTDRAGGDHQLQPISVHVHAAAAEPAAGRRRAWRAGTPEVLALPQGADARRSRRAGSRHAGGAGQPGRSRPPARSS